MLIKRILTSLVLAPCALALVFYTPLELFSIIAGGIVLLGAWEWSAFTSLKKPLLRSVYVSPGSAPKRTPRSSLSNMPKELMGGL